MHTVFATLIFILLLSRFSLSLETSAQIAESQYKGVITQRVLIVHLQNNNAFKCSLLSPFDLLVVELHMEIFHLWSNGRLCT